MGITSLSHIAIVAAVIGFFVAAWKIRQRRARGPVRHTPGARPPVIPPFLKGIALAALFCGAMLPAFSTDGFAPAIHMACTIALTILAAFWLFRPK